jgi:dihydropteroate synthase
VSDVVSFVVERCELARSRGVRPEQLIVDPGPDFAKSPAESVEALRAIDRLAALGHPWLAAVSRKYFLAAVTGRPPAERLAGTLAAVGYAADRGAAIVRVHDVAETVDFLAVREVLHGGAEIGTFDAEDDALKWIRAQTPSADL